jgi:hypothetical protein
MNKSFFTPLATFFLWAGATFAQIPEAPVVSTPQGEPALPAAGSGWEPVCSPGPAEPGPTRGGMFTADMEYVLWFLANSNNAAPLATTGAFGSLGAGVVGALGDAEHARREPASGARLAVGYWEVQDNCLVPDGIREWGPEAVFFFVGQRSASLSNNSFPNIVRPFFDLNNRQESAFIVAAPGLATGGITARAQASIWGAEANVWQNVVTDYFDSTCSLNVMAGFRYLDLDQRFDISSTSTFNQNLAAFPAFLPFAGNTLQVVDSFATHNHFYGGQVGLSAKWWPFSWMSTEAGAKLALGATGEDLTISGSQVRTLPDSTRIVSPAGLLALRSNSGSFHANQFSQVPELTFKISARASSHLTFSGGFSALYWSRVLRPGQQIDRSLDITQIPNFPGAAGAVPTGLNQPGVPFRQSDLWVLGIQFGMEINW